MLPQLLLPLLLSIVLHRTEATLPAALRPTASQAGADTAPDPALAMVRQGDPPQATANREAPMAADPPLRDFNSSQDMAKGLHMEVLPRRRADPRTHTDRAAPPTHTRRGLLATRTAPGIPRKLVLQGSHTAQAALGTHMERLLRDSLRARPAQGTHTDLATQDHPMALARLAHHTDPQAPGILTDPHALEILTDQASQAHLTAPALPAAPMVHQAPEILTVPQKPETHTVPRALETHTAHQAPEILTAPQKPEILTVLHATETHTDLQAPEILTAPRPAAGTALTVVLHPSRTRVTLATVDLPPAMEDNHPAMVDPAEILTDQDPPPTALAPSSLA